MFAAAFLLGLSGSLHCAGMCGPLCFIFQKGERNYFGLVVYNFSRILVYGLWGLLAGILGQSIGFTSYFPVLIFISGCLLLLVGVLSFYKGNMLDKIPFSEKLMGYIRNFFKPFFAKRNLWGYMGMGVFNAFIPCGLLYTALLAAIVQPDMGNAALFMISFGLGTFPAMMASQYIGNFVKANLGSGLRYVMPVVTIALALLLIYRSGIIQKQYFPPDTMEMTDC